MDIYRACEAKVGPLSREERFFLDEIQAFSPENIKSTLSIQRRIGKSRYAGTSLALSAILLKAMGSYQTEVEENHYDAGSRGMKMSRAQHGKSTN